MAVQPIPNGYEGVIPYLCVKDASTAIEFYKNIFGAEEVMRMPGPEGTIGHAELKIGGAIVMLADEVTTDDYFKSPDSIGGTPVLLHVYVEDVDAVFKRALEGGARELRPLKDEFYGDRAGGIEDPFGHYWHISTHKEDVPPDEIQRRVQEVLGISG